MDHVSTFSVTASEDKVKQAEGVVDALNDLLNELQKAAFSKWGRAKRLGANAYATPEVIELFKSSTRREEPNEEQSVPTDIVSKPDSYFGTFMLHYDRVVADNVVLVVMVFDVNDGCDKAMHGLLKIANS